MPELPEVETTRRGLAPLLVGRRVGRVDVREPRLRWPVPVELPEILRGRVLKGLDRRAKVLLFRFGRGTLLGHLGMSGTMRVCAPGAALRKHDHVRIGFGRAGELRLHDPRRFGWLDWTDGPVEEHPRLRALGPEPLGPAFDGAWLAERARGRSIAVKALLMQAPIVVGVGNIYASEALHRAGIHPARAAGRIGRARWETLADAIREVLAEAIEAGGTTLRDYRGGADEPGWFEQDLRVYGRAGQPCRACGRPIRRVVLAQRATYYCPACQR